jgi:hypothetical protein
MRVAFLLERILSDRYVHHRDGHHHRHRRWDVHRHYPRDVLRRYDRRLDVLRLVVHHRDVRRSVRCRYVRPGVRHAQIPIDSLVCHVHFPAYRCTGAGDTFLRRPP